MDNITIKIGGREIPLRFRMNQFAQIEEEIGNLGEIKDLILNGKKRIRNCVGVIRIMGNAGLKEEGQEPDLTDDGVLDAMDPNKMKAYQIAVLAAFTGGWKMETEEEKEHDVVLEEIERKKEPGN